MPTHTLCRSHTPLNVRTLHTHKQATHIHPLWLCRHYYQALYQPVRRRDRPAVCGLLGVCLFPSKGLDDDGELGSGRKGEDVVAPPVVPCRPLLAICLPDGSGSSFVMAIPPVETGLYQLGDRGSAWGWACWPWTVSVLTITPSRKHIKALVWRYHCLHGTVAVLLSVIISV